MLPPVDPISRVLVAAALDRENDGVIARDEFVRAGFEVDEAALDAVRMGGDTVTVSGLAMALSMNRVELHRGRLALARPDGSTPPMSEATAAALAEVLQRATAAVEEQERTSRDLPPTRALAGLYTEVKRQHGPTWENFLSSGVAGLAGGGLGLGMSALAGWGGVPMIALASTGVLALGLGGWLAGQLFKGGKLDTLRQDMLGIEEVQPAANRQELEEISLLAYQLSRRESFDADYPLVEKALRDLTERTEAQTERLRAAEPWVLGTANTGIF